jgi:hypothetical protein
MPAARHEAEAFRRPVFDKFVPQKIERDKTVRRVFSLT